MELCWEVKGYLADLIAKERLGRIQIIGMRVGIDPETVEVNAHPEVYHGGYDAYPGMNPNEKAALYLIEHTGNPNLLIETILDIAKMDGIGGKWYTKIFTELNSLMERTMQCRMDKKELNLIPIFDENLQTSEKETYIEKKLGEFRFNKTLINYKDALNTYKTSYKGTISLLRSTFESLVDEIITSKGESLKSNQKDKIAQLEKMKIIKEIDTQQCQKCQNRKKDREFNYSLHYGGHNELLTEDLANFLFINRYENRKVK